MKKILIINASQAFEHSNGELNNLITRWDHAHFTPENGFELQTTIINQGYEEELEVQKFLWADVIVYHFPIWWMYVPHYLKTYLDKVLTAGHGKLYRNDGRKAENPAINYGTGGLLSGKKYFVTTTWNAPDTAFTLTNEFFEERSVDDGVLFPFHKMNKFMALKALPSFHFHDVAKNIDQEKLESFKTNYLNHLQQLMPAHL